MKAYILSDDDIEKLLLMIDRDPKHGNAGGCSRPDVRDEEHDRVYDEVHRFYNFQVRRWLDGIKK